MIRNFWQKLFKVSSEPKSSENIADYGPKFRITVADFYDNISNTGAFHLAEALNSCEGIEAFADCKDFDHNFLNLESRNIFDLIDTGQNILHQNNSEVVIWGYREKDRIRLNFQNTAQYEDVGNSFISLMDCFYLPADMLDDNEPKVPSTLLILIYGIVISAVNNPAKEFQIYKKYLLKKIVHQLSQIDSAQSLGLEYMPYILNFLGIIYLSVAYDSSETENFKTIRSLFESALKHQNQILQPTHLGCIYYHLGQLFDSATHYIPESPSSLFRGAIKNYQMAQKYLSKYTYPYDYGYICYKLSGLYVSYWKQTEDTQALRDAVFQLREAEKVYTQALFPDFWARIEGNLGYLLQNLGHLTKSTEIGNLAIRAYQNQQKIVTEKNNPILWGEIQEKIGNIFYLQGRNHSDTEALEESLSCFHDALYVFETSGELIKAKQLKFDINKTYQTLSELKAADNEEETE